MKLYWGSGSPVSWRAQLALALKGIEYDSHRLDLGKREHRGDAFKAINPRGTFPVLVDDETAVRDSLAILAYLERRNPEPPLFGSTLAQTAAVWQLVTEHDAGIGHRTDTITRALFRDGGLTEPEPVREVVVAVKTDLSSVEELLGHGDWLVGPTPSAAEVVYYPTLHRLLRAAGKPGAAEVNLDLEPLADSFPRLSAWMASMVELPGVDATYPPHWRAGAS